MVDPGDAYERDQVRRVQYLPAPYAVRECPPGMNIRGGIPLQTKRAKLQERTGEVLPKKTESVLASTAKPLSHNQKEKNPMSSNDTGETMEFDPTVEDLSADADPRTRVTYVLTQFRNRVQILTAEKGKKLKDTASGTREVDAGRGRVDILPYNALKQYTHLVNGTQIIVGSVPGVEVGDLFVYRAEMMLIGLHKQSQRGIDFISESRNRFQDNWGDPVSAAVSVVASGGYKEDQDVVLGSERQIGDGHVYTYSGEGGNHCVGVSGSLSDQALDGGNRALRNCRDLGSLVRLIRRYPSCGLPSGLASPLGHIYRYDGMYRVTRCLRVRGRSGKRTLQYSLVREAGQPPLSLSKLEVRGPWNFAPPS